IVAFRLGRRPSSLKSPEAQPAIAPMDPLPVSAPVSHSEAPDPTGHPLANELIGQTIGQFQIVQFLGQGVLTRAYKAFQPTLDRNVALKVLAHIGDSQRDTVRTTTFTREARMSSKLSHPNILPVYAYGEDKGWAYIAEEYVERGTLAHRLHSSTE